MRIAIPTIRKAQPPPRQVAFGQQEREAMQELTSLLTDWYAGSEPFALATVIHTWGSSPRQPGAAMAVSTKGAAVGSVSGGCVEGAVYELAQESLGGASAATHHFGVSDDDAFAVGLTCGGKIDIFVEAVQPAEFGIFAYLAGAVQSTARRADNTHRSSRRDREAHGCHRGPAFRFARFSTSR